LSPFATALTVALEEEEKEGRKEEGRKEPRKEGGGEPRSEDQR